MHTRMHMPELGWMGLLDNDSNMSHRHRIGESMCGSCDTLKRAYGSCEIANAVPCAS